MLDPDAILEAIERDENIGFCTKCGEEHGECEPDARKYTCKSCGKSAVYGAEEILIAGFAD